MDRFMRLSKAQRIGIVLSILWAVGMGIYTHDDTVDRANKSAEWAAGMCQDGKNLNPNNPDNCDVKRAEMFKAGMEGDLGNSLVVAFGPLPFFWMVGFVLYYLWKIQVVGYRVIVQWSTLNRKKRAWVVWCFVFSFLVLLSCLISYLILIQDSRVPVSLGMGMNVFPEGSDYVYVEGTWTRPDLTNDSIAFPLQKSKIVCRKETGHCDEAKAYVFNGLLAVDTESYDIVSWTPAAIHMRNEKMCAIEEFTIDIATKTVSGYGHQINKNDPSCRVTWGIKSKDPEEWQYQMVDGYKVWTEQHKNARPYLLRLIQSFFGN